ncbi:hypothetical protein [Neisseria animaloris]|uniref:hypothetical protein n=1 Tax=Neisseria animaloris TaxID=326522 RepID=UPI000D3814F1|nr:hypothetical protein [Neisseria animaloris]
MNMNKFEYFLEGGEPVHRPSYCVFLDVLGFSQQIEKSYQEGIEDLTLREFYSIFQKNLGKIKSLETESSYFHLKTFSDNVLLVHTPFSDDLEFEFASIMWSLREYQFQMALRGLFVRGGFTFGPLFLSEDTVYGKALLDAYKLESEIAINPKVVLSEEVKSLVHEHIRYYANGDAPQKEAVLVDADGSYFINYLAECFLDEDEERWLDAKSLMLHKEQIEIGLRKFNSKSQIFSKYVWLAAYHNYFCDSASDCRSYDNGLKIDSELYCIHFSKIE